MFAKRCLVAAACVVLAAPAVASTWCGQNGVVRLSFTQGEELTSVTTAAPGESGVTLVDVWAYLDEVEPMARDGEVFLGIGGFELKLVIEGAAGDHREAGISLPAPQYRPGAGLLRRGHRPLGPAGRTAGPNWSTGRSCSRSRRRR